MVDSRVLSLSAAVLGAAACFTPNVDGSADSEPTSSGSGSTTFTGAAEDSTTRTGSDDTGSESGDSSETTTTGEPPSGSSSTGVAANCGDAELDAGEDCDDGNDGNDGNDVVGDGCNPDCRVSGAEIWSATVHEGEESASSTTWESSLTGAGSLLLHDLALFPDGGLVAVGEDESAAGTAGQDLLLSRYDASGTPLWSTSGESGPGDDRLRDVELDSQENVLVLGSIEMDATGRDLFVGKYAP